MSYSARRGRTRNTEMSPRTLRRKYLPRNPRRNINPAAHPTAAPAPAAAQVEHAQTNIRLERKTETITTTNGFYKLTPFKPGFEQQTERELAIAFKRPPRLFKEDKPFYPWLPKPTPIVNFHLNYKF
ncbi:MAG: hypothetical protein [Gammatorquevirus sp.]|nr:MAG: hypothetical protein [Gammatorquevirus sp.]